jgi:hypothetical protein
MKAIKNQYKQTILTYKSSTIMISMMKNKNIVAVRMLLKEVPPTMLSTTGIVLSRIEEHSDFCSCCVRIIMLIIRIILEISLEREIL